MRSSDTATVPRVVVVGGGIAALEAVLALRDLAGDRVAVTLVAPEPEFTLRAVDVAAPFTRGHADRLDLETFMEQHGGLFRRTAVQAVDADRRTLRCSSGQDEPYEVLIVAVGATARPAFGHAVTFGADPHELGGLLADLEQEYSHSVAFVVPAGCTWPLPLYELALMTAQQVWGNDVRDVRLHLVTPEASPLDLFGDEASAAVAGLLRAAGIVLHAAVAADVTRNNHVDLGDGRDLPVDRIVALPLLGGPALAGLPSDADGFIPVDDFGEVVGLDGVYAAGDATNHSIKQGGLTCQQADTIATCVAAAAGALVERIPYVPTLSGRLLTGHGDRFLRRGPEDGAQSEIETSPLWWPPVKVTGHYLAPYFQEQGIVRLPVHVDRPIPGMDVRLQLRVA